jgi:hypothetical protein
MQTENFGEASFGDCATAGSTNKKKQREFTQIPFTTCLQETDNRMESTSTCVIARCILMIARLC